MIISSTRITIRLNDAEKVKKFINTVNEFKSDIDIISGRYICDAKSLMGVLTHTLTNPVDINIHSQDEEEVAAFNEAMEEFK